MIALGPCHAERRYTVRWSESKDPPASRAEISLRTDRGVLRLAPPLGVATLRDYGGPPPWWVNNHYGFYPPREDTYGSHLCRCRCAQEYHHILRHERVGQLCVQGPRPDSFGEPGPLCLEPSRHGAPDLRGGDAGTMVALVVEEARVETRRVRPIEEPTRFEGQHQRHEGCRGARSSTALQSPCLCVSWQRRHPEDEGHRADLPVSGQGSDSGEESATGHLSWARSLGKGFSIPRRGWRKLVLFLAIRKACSSGQKCSISSSRLWRR